MNYQCKNCGGNVVFSPKRKAMFCPYCDGENSEEIKGNDSLITCASCGGELTITEFTSASRCPYCNNYLIFDKRIQGEYEPSLMIPFKIDKDEAVELMEKEFKKRIFTPSSFLSEKTLCDLNGRYVPFFLYDYDVFSNFQGTGTKVRSWTSGDYRYTETSYFQILRCMEAQYDNVPADASTEMDDKVMDLLEPFEYKDLMSFEPKYLSGFFGEIYNAPSDAYEGRAKQKVTESADALLRESYTEYSRVTQEIKEHKINPKGNDYTLLPVWVYAYNYRNNIYNFYVNGQTGKVIGRTPVSKAKVLIYGATVGLLTCAALTIISMIAGV